MASDNVERVYKMIMALSDEEKLKFGEKYLALQKKERLPTEGLELWVERLKIELGRD